jgi:GNAT superfamily N-acetyltransferase
MSVELLAPGDAARWVDAWVEVYRAAFSGPPYERTEREVLEFGRALPLHLGRAGFRAALARGEDGRAVGFAYGYLSVPGQWWHDNVAASLGRAAAREWLGDAFQLTELAVRPEFQGRGLGKGLHDALLAGVTAPRAVLSTLDTRTVAFEMYLARGWAPLLRGFRFPGVARLYAVLGKVMAG